MDNLTTSYLADKIDGELIGEARKISDIKVIVKSGRHKAQRIILRDNAMCMVDKKLKYIK